IERTASAYKSLFNIDEISNDITLKGLSGAIFLGFYVTFASWIYSPLTTVKAVENKTYICWPFFQDCRNLIFLQALPDGYSQTFVYMVLFGLMLLGAYAM